MTQQYKYLHFIDYILFQRWDVKAYAFQQKVFKNAVLLREILTPYNVPLSKEKMIDKGWSIIAKINFAGELFLRAPENTKTFKGNVHEIDGETLIYSKINVRHGCVYYHPKDSIPFGVSSEYPAYKIDNKRVNGDFLVLLLQSQYFKNALSAGTSGISKARVKPNVFLDIQIPLPSLAEQNKIVAAYDATIAQAELYSTQAKDINDQIKYYLRDKLEIETIDHNTTEKQTDSFLYFINYSTIDKWGTDFMIKNIQSSSSTKYKTKKICQLCNISSGGTPNRGRKEYYGGNIPWIKTGELKNEILTDTEEKLTPLGMNNSSAKLYPKGSLIVAMYGATIGKTAKLGVDATTNQACAVLFDIDNKQIQTDYLWLYLQSQTDKLKAMAYGGAQPNINAGIVANYEIPLPPVDTQNEIVEHITRLRNKQKDLQQKSLTLRQQATQQFEQIIFN